METKLVNFIRSLPVLEPLSQATAQTLKPSDLAPTDHLEVEMDSDMRRFLCRAVYLYKGKKQDWTPSVAAREEWYKRLPEVFEVKGHPGVMSVAATDFSALVMMHQWPEDRLIFKVDPATGISAARSVYEFLLTRFLSQTHNALVGAAFKVNREVPAMPEDYIEHPSMPLADYQKVGFRMSIGQEVFNLFMQQGTGKTPVCIARICYEARRARLGKDGQPRMLRVLVVCPRQARLNWQNEIERFAVVGGKVCILRGGFHRRLCGITDAVTEDKDCEFSVCVCSYESIENTWEAIGAVPWDLVIADESHYMKNQNAVRSKAMRKLRDTTGRRMNLTGTPIVNHVFDLWAQWEFLAEGMSGFLTFEKFRKFYGVFERAEGAAKKGGGVEKLLAMKNLPLIQERLARISFSITKKEAGLNLPEKMYDIYEVTMSATQREYYRKMQKELALQIKKDLKDKKLTADHILTRMLRLAQITSGHVKWDAEFDDDGEMVTEGKVEQIDPINLKAEAVVEMVKENLENDPGMKTIVWCCFREDIRIVGKYLKDAGIQFVEYYGAIKDADRDAAVMRFNSDPTCAVFLANQSCASEAINLLGYPYWNTKPEDATTHTGHEIYVSQDWSPVKRSQSEDRAHRRGTRSNVRITDLMVPGTVDEEIRARVHLKRETALEIQDVKRILNSLIEAEVDGDE